MHTSVRDANLVTAWAMWITTEVHAVEGAAGLNPSALAAVATVFNRPGTSIEALRSILGLSHPGCVRLVDRLCALGLARRERGEDARAVALFLTAKGKRLAERIHHNREQVVTDALAGLDDPQRRALRKLLE